MTGVVVKQYQALVPGKSFADLDQKDETGVVIQTFNDQNEAIKQRLPRGDSSGAYAAGRLGAPAEKADSPLALA